MTQALRIDLDDVTIARLAPIARGRSQTIQELLATLAVEYVGLVAPTGRSRGQAYCPGCQSVVTGPFRRGLCPMHYMRSARAGKAG